jgi:hypothetical protein
MPRVNSVPIELNIVQANRFWSNVSGMGRVDTCWLWSGRVDGFGYGHFKNQKRSLKAHRVAWTLKRGPIPAGMTLDHLCRNPRCVNPMHLEIVTNKENILRGTSPTAVNALKTHCKRGHELTPENIWTSRGKRACKQCLWDKRHPRRATESFTRS